MKKLIVLGVGLVASPAFAHHEVVVAASSIAVIPTLAFLSTAAALFWRRWRGK